MAVILYVIDNQNQKTTMLDTQPFMENQSHSSCQKRSIMSNAHTSKRLNTMMLREKLSGMKIYMEAVYTEEVLKWSNQGNNTVVLIPGW